MGVVTCPACGRGEPPVLVSMREAARRCGRSMGTMRAWRRTWLPGAGPQLGPEPLPDASGSIRYLAAEVDAWVARQVEEGRARNATPS